MTTLPQTSRKSFRSSLFFQEYKNPEEPDNRMGTYVLCLCLCVCVSVSVCVNVCATTMKHRELSRRRHLSQDFYTLLLVLERSCSHKQKVYVKRAFQQCRMSYHPCGDTVEIVGVNSPTNRRSCEEHPICGEVVIEDVVLHLRKVQVLMNQQEQSTIAAF